MKKILLFLTILFFAPPLSSEGQKIYYQPPSGGGTGTGGGMTEAVANGLYWRLLGNANTTSSNFLGTTDAKPLVFKTNGVMVQTILASGNVGINTATPMYKLDVDANATGNPLRLQGLMKGNPEEDKILTSNNGVVRWIEPAQLKVEATPQTDDWHTTGNQHTDHNYNFLGTTDAKDLVFRTNNMERLRMLAAGNVGIGTPTPQYKLQVLGNISGDRLRYTERVHHATPYAASKDATDASVLVRDATTGMIGESNLHGLVAWSGGNQGELSIGTNTPHDLSLETGNAEALRILHTGEIEIRKTPPHHNLPIAEGYINPTILYRDDYNDGKIEGISPYSIGLSLGLMRVDTLTAWKGREYRLAENAHDIFITGRTGVQTNTDSIVFLLPTLPRNGQEINIFAQKNAKLWVMDIIIDASFSDSDSEIDNSNSTTSKDKTCIEFGISNNPKYNGLLLSPEIGNSFRISLKYNYFDRLWTVEATEL